MAEMLDLPLELQGLVAFLGQDNRPSVLLDDEEKVLFANGKFEHLHLDAGQVKNVLQQLQPNGAATAIDGHMWRRTQVLNRWSTLVCSGTLYTSPETSDHVEGPDLDTATTNNSSGGQHCTQTKVHPGDISREALLDWTRFDVPGLSPWIQYAKEYDWSTTALGPMSDWPLHVRQSIVYMMSVPNPRLMVWNAGNTFLYNEACIPLWGAKHPACFGKPVNEPFSEIWDEVKPLIEGGLDGKMTTLHALPAMLQRGDVPDQLEETYMDFALMPLCGPDGKPVGLLDEVTEVTKTVRSERRRVSVINLMQKLTHSTTLKQLWSTYLDALETCYEDIAYAMVYSVVDDTPATGSADTVEKKCMLEGSVGLRGEHANQIASFSVAQHLQAGPGLVQPCLEVYQNQKAIVLHSSNGSLPESLATSNPDRAFGDKVRSAMVTPITSVTGGGVLGILILGLSPRCPYDEEYELWTQLLADTLGRTASLILLPEEQRRAQKVTDALDAVRAELRSTTLQVERSEAKFRRMAESAPTGMYMFDAEGRTIRTNDAYLKMLGDTEEQHAERRPDAQKWADMVHPEDLARFIESWDHLKATKSPITVEYRLKKPWKSVDKATGQTLTGERWLLATGVPDIGPDGKVQAVLGWLTDISHRKFSENLLAQRLEEALANKRQSENFIDMTSHEMRNPLSAILQSADSIVSTLTGEAPASAKGLQLSTATAHEVIDAANTIILCAQHQKRIVDDILTLSKLDASLLVISPDKVQAPALMEKALKMYESEIARAQIDASLCIEQSYFDLDIDEVVVDASRLLQVVINLLTNAIKFTQYSDKRRIRLCLGASRERPTGKHHNVTFIPSRHSSSEQMTKPEWGEGEQLYLQVAVSDSGRGLSEEEMRLLFQRFQQASPRTYKQYGGSGLGLFISRELCELQGGQIGVCSSQGNTTFTFFVKAKRSLPEGQSSAFPTIPAGPRSPSASASPIAFSRRGSKMLSANDVSGHHRQSGVQQIAGAHAATAQSTTESIAKTTTRLNNASAQDLHILLVEDNVINQQVMSRLLRKAGCTVHVANHGQERLDFLERTTFCSQATPLSLVLLDVEMPTMDGLTCIRHIREHQRNDKIRGHIPVIAVTANARSEQISAALSAGMDQVVTKPFRIPELVPQMVSLINEVAQRPEG